MDYYCSFLSCEKLDQVANWVGAGVVSAFFASLERCSCINLTTNDVDDGDDEEESKDRPLMLTQSVVDPENFIPQENPVHVAAHIV